MGHITSSEKETFNFAKKFAKRLKGGEIIGLTGDLGAGKTVFAKGLAAGLGVKKNITSPTFVLMKVYQTKYPNIKYLIHIDAYRLKTPQDLIAIGAEEYFNRPDTVTVIEWADKIKKILPKKTKYIGIINKDENKRIIIFLPLVRRQTGSAIPSR
ncbi:tRNA (adenosine(37)-N6)-threonylcarbamoyltransferase complex ATPase subunit type 1 TsaE [Candidatus Parcubacteria bacterium]|nr:tRNA (adenosine(37)-N6)-threonylcarbamoyltransferase complex ATPase subunit type 1 TsaE [Candidatus Parcubacteria bacterium]